MPTQSMFIGGNEPLVLLHFVDGQRCAAFHVTSSGIHSKGTRMADALTTAFQFAKRAGLHGGGMFKQIGVVLRAGRRVKGNAEAQRRGGAETREI